MHDSAQVLGRSPVSRAAGLRVVLNEDLGAVALALGHHADVEAGVEQLARGELPEGADRSVEVQSGPLLAGGLTELRGLDGQARPPLAPAETATDLGEGEAAGRWRALGSGWARFRPQPVEPESLVFQG